MALDPQMKVMLESSDPFEALSSYAKQRLKAGLSNDEVLAEFEVTRTYLREIDRAGLGSGLACNIFRAIKYLEMQDLAHNPNTCGYLTW